MGAVIGRGQCKTPRGKLVAVSVRLDGIGGEDIRIVEAHVDGDFLIDVRGSSDDPAAIAGAGTDGDANTGVAADDMTLIADLERTIERQSPPIDPDRFRADLITVLTDHPHAGLVGVSPDAIITATGRAIRDAGGDDATGTGVVTANQADSAVPDAPSLDGQGLFAERWHDLHPQIILDAEPYAPALQMALDQTIAEAVAAGSMPPTLRFWRWAGPAVVIGAYQSVRNEVDAQAAAVAGFDVVRRVTGGGAMFVRPDDTITYSLYVPASFVAGIPAEESYRLCDAWAFSALRSLGVPAVPQPLNDIAMPDGGKIGGAAQRRFPARRGSSGPGCVLHHVTMAYDIDAEQMVRMLRVSREKLSDKGVRSAKRRVEPIRMNTTLSRERFVEALRRHALADIAGARSAELSVDTIDRARALAAERFSNPAWTYRID
ncbi:lipoate-protein ligase A [Bifidobacterium margollesii]|uniref:Lipoate-protein ligase A n=1 Tax=Bifidobacterium margollesii TaxID=2020964 RepID=A0A2N5J950_9BIFI|nr:biotin/lipoate A/B protein ligase family protein [Bifidobacterium margollesii]PLS30739.1 lipoate-protein ligase A [Bifidobacterium margollesii]